MSRSISGRERLMYSVAVMALAMPLAAHAEVANFNIEAQPLTGALKEFGLQSRYTVVAQPDVVSAKRSRAVSQSAEPEVALAALLQGTGLGYRRDGDTFLIVKAAADPQSGSAAGDGAEVEALIVTAQKREENIQDVPIAISAFSAKALEEQKIEGGFDLLKAIPNVTFSKNNFTSYNFSIRGIGTKAVSATTDPGVAVSFNNIALLQNRLFEQEYFDVERVEVLRGPQGTLYGRNATAGVVNVISAKPDMDEFKGSIKGEVGNYHSKRLSAMLNVPLVEDKLAIRFAGALTDRQGYDYNLTTKNAINGRDLWSARVTLAFNPTDRIRSNLIWERFEEDDNRSRTGKQLCHRDDGPEFIGETSVPGTNGESVLLNPDVRRAVFAQGCKAGSLYDAGAFGTPNGLSYNFVLGLLALRTSFTSIGYLPGSSDPATIIDDRDPYGGLTQSANLREIASIRDPRYRAKADVIELNVDFDLTDELTLSSQTAYNKDQTYSFQDYNRFNTLPVFTDTSGLLTLPSAFPSAQPSPFRDMARGGIFCDPQIGCSDSIAGFDIASASGQQFSHEIRVQSDFDRPVNFSAGLNYTRFKTLVDYYVMFNLITAMAQSAPFNQPVDFFDPTLFNPLMCPSSSFFYLFPPYNPVATDDPLSACPYVDPNPVESMDGEGHNYFRSKNPYKLTSAAAFGELYWEINDTLKLTAGLRYTNDRKTFIPVPSQVLLAPSLVAGGFVGKGYPEEPAVKQHWGEWTGRLGMDWKPKLSFTDETMVYAFYSRGYKGGGANPPKPGFGSLAKIIERGLLDPDLAELLGSAGLLPVLRLTGNEYADTFQPEFVDALEVGAKNTLLGGALTFNANAFFYDYKDYQVSQIRDRTAVNENFDAKVWGLEFQSVFAPSANLQVIANLGYLDSKIGKGEKSIDIMNRTQGDPNYVIAKPWSQLPSNCVVPADVAESWLQTHPLIQGYWWLCGGLGGILMNASPPPEDPNFDNTPYNVANYPEINGGSGLFADLGGNRLPNAPHWTANLGAQYGFDILEGWRATVRGDAYWQSQSWARVYNSNPYDKLHGWYNLNLSLWLENEDGLKIELYAKNVLDEQPITDAFLNSDDTGLTTNVFTLDPRLIGLSIRKGF